MEFIHETVLIIESIKSLDIKPAGIYVDGTLGGGGHALQIVQRLDEGLLVGIDQDREAIEAARARLAIFGERFTAAQSNFSDFGEVLDGLGIERIDGMLLDLGVSSYQLDNPERGFSYMHDGALDMRMNRDGAKTAWEVVNSYSRERLAEVIRDYGEERWADRIAEFIVSARPIETTFELVEIIKQAIPASARRTGPHPAKRTFQAIRIEVNDELAVIEETIARCVDRLKSGGRLAIITFHSLEDRIVKNAFRSLANPCVCPPEMPRCTCGKRPRVQIITKKPIVPSEEELRRNPRARSAKLRVIEKLPEKDYGSAH